MIVMKFGGTSVEDAQAIRRVADIVRGRIQQQPVVVSSAMAKVTDTLLQAASTAASGDEQKTFELLGHLESRHMTTACELLRDPVDAKLMLVVLFSELRPLLKAVCALREVSPRLSDRIVSFGERLSTVLVSFALREAVVDAVLVDARRCIVTDDQFTCAAPLADATYRSLRENLQPLLDRKQVAVLGGFIASNAQGITTTLGRGGSDFTAALVGAALDAQRVEIWTDVDGIRTADPRLYPGAGHIETLSFHEAAELSHLGAKVLHPATLLPAIEKNIPVHVLNSRNPEHSGTCVQAACDGDARVKAIAVKNGITLVEASTPRALRRHGLAREVFAVLEDEGCLPDIASISDTSVSVTVDRNAVVSQLRERLDDEVQLRSENSKALVSLVADDIRGVPGLPAQVFSALEGLDVWLVTHGASRRSLSFVVAEADAAEAVRRLHRNLFEEPHAQLPTRYEVPLAAATAS